MKPNKEQLDKLIKIQSEYSELMELQEAWEDIKDFIEWKFPTDEKAKEAIELIGELFYGAIIDCLKGAEEQVKRAKVTTNSKQRGKSAFKAKGGTLGKNITH